MPKTPPKFDWPRQYLLNLYAEAVKHGYVLVGPLDEERANSLRLSLYRLRRRSDAKGANATFILPEYHLVTVGHLTPAGELPIIFNRVPEAQGDLPSFRVPDESEVASAMALPSAGHVPRDNYVDPAPAADDAEGLSGEALNEYLLDMLKKSSSSETSS